jgi:hypothetical protein
MEKTHGKDPLCRSPERKRTAKMFVKCARLSLNCHARQQILNLVCLVGQSTVHPITSTQCLTIFFQIKHIKSKFPLFTMFELVDMWVSQNVLCWATDRQLTGNTLSIYFCQDLLVG